MLTNWLNQWHRHDILKLKGFMHFRWKILVLFSNQKQELLKNIIFKVNDNKCKKFTQNWYLLIYLYKSINFPCFVIHMFYTKILIFTQTFHSSLRVSSVCYRHANVVTSVVDIWMHINMYIFTKPSLCSD